jgi:hypothetical protein
MCMKVEACSESARCPHVRSSRYEALVCGNPYHTPHTDGELQPRVDCWSGYIVEKVLHPGQKLGFAGRRRLDATERPPISIRAGHDLLPAASFGATCKLNHSASLYRVRW